MAEPQFTKHIPSLEQNYPKDEYIPQPEQQSNLHHVPDDLNTNYNNENKAHSSSPPPPPLVNMVALITPKQNKNSKKWSVGVNHSSTAVLFEYLESARLCIQNDGRLFIPGSKTTLSATHSSLSSSLTSIPRISHISVPRTIYFNNNSVVRINREWHIGELLPIIYTANIQAPNVSNYKHKNNDYISVHSALSETMLVAEQPLSSDLDSDSDNDSNPHSNDDTNNAPPNSAFPSKPEHNTMASAPSRSYLHVWSSASGNISSDHDIISNNNIIAINKIIHDHNHNHNFFWSHYYDHDTAYYDKAKSDSDENKLDSDTYSKFLTYLRDNEDENANIDMKTQISLIKMDLINAINNNNNPATTAHYKYINRYSDTNMIHRPLAITHGNNIIFLLFPDGNLWSSYTNHLLQPQPFQPDPSKINPLDPTHKNPKHSFDATVQSLSTYDNKGHVLISPSPMLSEVGTALSPHSYELPLITPLSTATTTANPSFIFQSKTMQNSSANLPEMDETTNNFQSPMNYTATIEKKNNSVDYVKKTLNKPFKTRPLVIGDWRIGEGEHRWFLIKYVSHKQGDAACENLQSAMSEHSKLDWELSEEESRSTLVFMISPAGRIWSCCSGGCWFNTGVQDKTFNDKYMRFNDKQHKSVSTPLPFCRAGLTMVPQATFIRPNINYYDTHLLDERELIIRQLRCLCMPNEIVPLCISSAQGDKLRGLYTNIVYGMDKDNKQQRYFVHYNCFYLHDSWQINNDIYFDRTRKVEGYAPYALCIVTRYPYHNSFMRILENFINIRDKNAITNESFIQNLYQILSSTAFKQIGAEISANDNETRREETIMIECANGDTVLFENNAHFVPLPNNINFYTPSLHADINWSVLFRVLEPMNILTVITALLQEKKIIFLTNHPSILFPICQVLLSLIYPFQWIHFYRPLIPPCDPYINQYLSYDKPALFGLLTTSITKLPASFNGIIVRLDSNNIELHNCRLSVLPSKLKLWLFASIIQNADFYLYHRPEQRAFIKVPQQIDKRQIDAIRSPQFRQTYMNTGTSNSPQPPPHFEHRPSLSTHRLSYAYAKSMQDLKDTQSIEQSETTRTPNELQLPNPNFNYPIFDICTSKSLPGPTLIPLSTPSMLSESIDGDLSDEEYKQKQDEKHPKIYRQHTFTPSPSYFEQDTVENTSSEVVVDGQEIISIVDRVLLSNFSLNHSSSLIHEHLTDYTQTPSKPDPLPEVRDAPPDKTWVEPTVFRKYQYYHAHMNGAKQTLLSLHRKNIPYKQRIDASFCEFTVTHQVIVPSQQTDPDNISGVSGIGPLMSATSIVSQTSHNTNKMYVNHSYAFSKTFTGLCMHGNVLHEDNSDFTSNQSGVLNWLFGSGKAVVSNNEANNKNKPELNVNINLLRNHFMRAFASLLCGFWKYIVPVKYSTTTNVQFDSHGFLGSRQEFNYNKQPLEELLLACDERQKDEIENIILRLQLQFDIFFVHELFIPPNPKFNQLYMQTFYNINNNDLILTPRAIAKFYLTQVYQDAADSKVDIFLDEYLPSIIDSATIIADNFEKINEHNNESMMNRSMNDEISAQSNVLFAFEEKHSEYTYSNAGVHSNNNEYEACVPAARDELSSLILSQFLDGLLSTLLWTHLITHWHYNDNLNCNSIIHPFQSINKSLVLPTDIYFNYIDIALRAYKIDREKLRALRCNILLSMSKTSERNPIMFKHTQYKHNKSKKSIVVIRKPKEKKDELHCGFSKPWNIRFCRDTAESVQDLQNIFRENVHMIVVNVSWNYRIGAVIGYQQSKLLFESWFASFIRRLKELSLNEPALHEYKHLRTSYDCEETVNILSDNIGIQIFVRDPRSLKAVVSTLKRRKERHDLGGLSPARIWISANMLNATQPSAIAKELIISPAKFFNYVDLIPEFTICLAWCTRGGGIFTKKHMDDMKKIVDQFIFKKKPKMNVNKSVESSSPSSSGKSSTYKISKRSFCFYVRASHLFVGDGWKYLHSMLLDRFPTSSVVFTAREEGISITNFKWLSAHFPTNRSFYTFENRDIQNDIQHLDLLHHVVEATKSPLWYGELRANRRQRHGHNHNVRHSHSHSHRRSHGHSLDGPRDEEEKLIYLDGGVLSSEWRTGRFLERSKVYFYNHRFAIVNRGWVLSKHELYPPWKMNGRALITGYTQLHILFRTPGAVHKPTSHGNVAYGIRATITTKGEFALETVRLDGQSKKVKSKIDNKVIANKRMESMDMNMEMEMEADLENGCESDTYKNYKHTSSKGFIFPQSTSAAAMHTMAFSFELIDYGALYPIRFSIQQLRVSNGYPISRKQSITMQVSYPKNHIKCPWYHYVVFNSHQNAMWPILVDRLVIKKNISIPIKNKHLLHKKKTFKKKHFGGGISQRKNIGDML